MACRESGIERARTFADLAHEFKKNSQRPLFTGETLAFLVIAAANNSE